MKKLLILVLVALVCSSLGPVVDAASFECNDEPEACKAKFKTEFLKEFKSVFLKGSQDLMTAYIETARAILAELPDDDPFRKPFEEAVNNVDGCLKKLNKSDIDVNDIKDIMIEGMEYMIFEAMDGEPSPALREAMRKHNMEMAIKDVIARTAIHTIDLWFELYPGLREKDLEAYPEYKMVTDLFKATQAGTDMRTKENCFTGALEVLFVKFQMSIFEPITRDVRGKHQKEKK